MLTMCELTFRRVREPAFIVLVLLGTVLAYSFSGLGAFELPTASADGHYRSSDTMMMAGTALLLFMGCLVAVFCGATEVPRDISSRMIAVFLSKPISRSQYLFGKFLGILLITLSCTATWLTVMLVAHRMGTHENALTFGAVVFQFFCLMLLVPVTAIASTFSCFFGDVSAMVVTAIYVILGFAVGLVPVVVNVLPETIGNVVLIPYFFVPNFVYFLDGNTSLVGMVSLVVYAVSVTLVFIGIGQAHFRHSDVL